MSLLFSFKLLIRSSFEKNIKKQIQSTTNNQTPPKSLRSKLRYYSNLLVTVRISAKNGKRYNTTGATATADTETCQDEGEHEEQEEQEAIAGWFECWTDGDHGGHRRVAVAGPHDPPK